MFFPLNDNSVHYRGCALKSPGTNSIKSVKKIDFTSPNASSWVCRPNLENRINKNHMTGSSNMRPNNSKSIENHTTKYMLTL